MLLKLAVHITERNPFFARARAYAKSFFLFGWVVVSSSGLINAGAKRTNEALDRWQKNREMSAINAPDAERNLMDSLMSDSSPIVRQGAAQQLGNYSQNPLVVRALAYALRNDLEKSVRYACALSLGLSRTFKAITALERALNDSDPDLRRQIAFSLKRHRIGAGKVRANLLLKKLQKDSDPSVREMAGEK